MTLAINRYPDGNRFLAAAQSWLEEKEVEHNVLLSVAHLLTGEHHFQEPIFLGTVTDSDQITGCALLPPPDGLYLTAMPRAAIPQIVRQLAECYDKISVVTGPEPVVADFAERWRPGEWSVQTRLRWHSITRPVDSTLETSGRLRQATDSDMQTLDSWAPIFAREFGTRVDVKFLFRTMMGRGLLNVWDDDGPKCVISVSGLTPTAARISSLFTPLAYRRHGYAAAAVGAASNQVFAAGRRLCCASTDITSPGPNAIFSAAGFSSGDEFVVVHL